VVITSIYILAALAVYHQKVIFAAPPDPARPDHVASTIEVLVAVGLNVGIAMIVWGMMRRYTGPGPAAELLPREGIPPPTARAAEYSTEPGPQV